MQVKLIDSSLYINVSYAFIIYKLIIILENLIYLYMLNSEFIINSLRLKPCEFIIIRKTKFYTHLNIEI